MLPSPSPPRPPPQQQAPRYRHFCRVCNKGFTCGSALGGHMRAHGVGVGDGDGFGDADDDDDEDSLGGDEDVRRPRGVADDLWNAGGPSTSGTATHVYALRANPNRLTRSRQVCKNCEKEFTSWEHFLEHGRCSSGEDDDEETDRSLQSWSPSPAADGEEDPAPASGWSKGKRSRCAKPMGAGDDLSPSMAPSAYATGEEEDLANCLVMLSSSSKVEHVIAEVEQESSASARLQPITFVEPAPTIQTAIALATVSQYVSPPVARALYECKACKKVFTSHQALGGHRASHKKVKGCFAAKLESNVSQPPRATVTDADNSLLATSDPRTNVEACTDGPVNAGRREAAAALSMAIAPMEPPVAALAAAPSNKKGKMHECSVCHRLFTSGQALGGHKRCHWLTSSSVDHTSPVANLPPLAEDLVGAACQQLPIRSMLDAAEPALDLSIGANPPQLASAASVRAEVGGSSFHLHAPSPECIRSAAIPRSTSHKNIVTSMTGSQNANDNAGLSTEAENEADSTTVKRARLSDLKDVSMAGEMTPWLQVGIGSSSRGGGDDDDKE